MTVKSTYEEVERRIRELKIAESDRDKILEGLRETEEKHKNAMNRYETLFENPTMGIFQTNVQGNILYVNDVMAKMFGYGSPEKLKAENVATLYKDPEVRAHLLEELKINGKIENFEADFVKKNGKTITVLFNGVFQDGVLSGNLIDISKRKQIENKLIESEAYNKILFRASRIAHVVMDPETGKFTDCNPAAARIYGYSDCTEVIGKTPLDMSAPFQYDGTDSAAASVERDKTALDKGHHLFLWKHQRPVGTIWDGEVALFAYTYKKKQMLQYIVKDITGQKKTQDALKKSNFFLGRSQRVGKIGSFVLNIPKDDPGAHTWESTPEMDRIFGIDATYPRTGESWLALIVQHDEVLAYFNEQVFKTQKTFEKEYQIIRPSDGDIRWIFGRGELEFDDQGNCIRMIGTVQDITERKRAAEMLSHSRAQLSEAMKMACASYWEYDVVSDIFTFSDHFYRIFRTTAEDVGGYHMSSAEYIHRFCHPEDAHVVEREVRVVVETSDPKYTPQIEYRILYADGEVGNVVVRFFIVKGDQGRTIRCFGFIQDITERKRAEEFRRFTQFAIDNTVDQAFWTTADGHITYVNDAACHTLGYTREELLKMSIPDIGPTFSPEVFEQHWRDLKKNGNATFESFHRARGGRVYPVEIRANYVQFDGKEYNCAFATDITERKANEEELRKRDRLLNDVGRQAKIGGWKVDLETGRITNTDEIARIYDLASKEDVDLDVGIGLYHGDSRKKIKDAFNKLVKDGTPYDLELEIISAKGHHKWVNSTGYPVIKEGRIAVVQGLFQDITARKQMELERENLIAELQTALAEIKELRGILPICANCKKIRDDKGYWTQIESYIHEHSNAEFSHGICPDCAKKLYPELYE